MTGAVVVSPIEETVPERFGEVLAARLAAQPTRLLHLTWIPSPADGGSVLAVYCVADAVRGLAAPASPPSRPSLAGVGAATLEEARLAAEGFTWAQPAPERAIIGRGIFTFPLGPVRADVAESLGWRFAVMGDEVLGLDLRSGYKPRQLEARMGPAGPEGGLALAERVSGTAPVGHALAYCLAWEAALGRAVPAGQERQRAIMAELERLASHLGDLAALANATGLPAAAAELFVLKEHVLRYCQRWTGHRYQRGVLTVGGARELAEPDPDQTLGDVASRFAAIIDQLDRSASFLDRLHTAGRVCPEVAVALRPVGPAGRACGLPYDVRADAPYGWYARAGAPERCVAEGGDAFARYRIRVGEVEASLTWLAGGRGPDGAAPPPEGPPAVGTVWCARVEAPRGELVYLVCPGPVPWVRVRSASAVNWAVVPPAAAAGNVLQDLPIIDASFSLSVAALDR